MARLVTSGFEYQDTQSAQLGAPDGAFSGGSNATIETTIVRSGAASLKCGAATGNTGSSGWSITVVLGSDVFVRTFVYVPTGGLPAGGSDIISIGSSFGVRMASDGTLTLQSVVGGVFTQQGSASAAISLNAWNRVDLRGRIDTGAIDQCEARLGGVSFASASGLTISDAVPTNISVGNNTFSANTPGAGTLIYHDDVAVNDSTGASQTSWPADSNIALLRPTVDSAVGTGWTLGNTTATGGNAWQRLDGVPDSAADLTTAADADQIRNATSNANVNYDATMTTYTAAGVTGTVNVVVPLVATGAPVVTSAKAGTVGVASNPAIANVALGAGGTSGAFWSGVAMGTYPTGNKWSFGTTTYAPTVTLGTAPVMRVTQVTASTRIAIVTEMGIYVDYTPAVVIAPTPLVHQSVPFYPTPSHPS